MSPEKYYDKSGKLEGETIADLTLISADLEVVFGNSEDLLRHEDTDLIVVSEQQEFGSSISQFGVTLNALSDEVAEKSIGHREVQSRANGLICFLDCDLHSRLYLPVSVGTEELSAMLVSGTTQSCIRNVPQSWIDVLDLKVSCSRSLLVAVANGARETVLGVVSIPTEIRGVIREMEFLILPGLSHRMLFGIEVLRIFGIGLDGSTEEWWLSNSDAKFFWGSSDQNFEINSLDVSSDERREQIEDLVERLKYERESEANFTPLIVHDIVGPCEFQPVRQRVYPVSPPILEEMQKQLDELLLGGVVEPSESPWRILW